MLTYWQAGLRAPYTKVTAVHSIHYVWALGGRVKVSEREKRPRAASPGRNEWSSEELGGLENERIELTQWEFNPYRCERCFCFIFWRLQRLSKKDYKRWHERFDYCEKAEEKHAVNYYFPWRKYLIYLYINIYMLFVGNKRHENTFGGGLIRI